MLRESEEYMQNVFEKPQDDLSEYTNDPDEYLSMSIDRFVSAFNSFIYRKKRIEEVHRHYERVERQRVSVEQRIAHIKSLLSGRSEKDKISFTELVEDRKNDRYSIVITFTSLLEMAKARAIEIRQKSNFSEIFVSRGEKLEEYDAAEAAKAEIAETKEAAADDK